MFEKVAPKNAPSWFKDAVETPCRQEGFVECDDDVQLHYLHWPCNGAVQDANKKEEEEEEEEGESLKKRKQIGKAQPLIFIHGNGAHAFWYAFIAPFFNDDYDVYALTFSGCGDSSSRSSVKNDGVGAYSTSVYSGEIMHFCKQLGLFSREKKPLIVSHSFGSITSYHLALQHAESFAGIVFSDVNITDRPEATVRASREAFFREARKSRMYARRDSWNSYILSTTLPKNRIVFAPVQTVNKDYVVEYIANTTAKSVGHDTWHWKGDCDRSRKLEFAGDETPILNVDSLRALREQVPVAWIYGENSAFQRDVPACKVALKQIIPRLIPCIGIPNAQHHLFLDEPLAFVSAVRAVLTGWNLNSRL